MTFIKIAGIMLAIVGVFTYFIGLINVSLPPIAAQMFLGLALFSIGIDWTIRGKLSG